MYKLAAMLPATKTTIQEFPNDFLSYEKHPNKEGISIFQR